MAFSFPVYKFRDEFACTAGNFYVIIGKRDMIYGRIVTVLQFKKMQSNEKLMSKAAPHMEVVPGLIREMHMVFCNEQSSDTGETITLDYIIEMLVFMWNMAPTVGQGRYPFKGFHNRLPKYAPLVKELVKMKSDAPVFLEFLHSRGLRC